MMTIKQIEVTVGEIVDGYVNNDELGVRGYGGRLDIRPPYQREFIYNEKEQQAVITTVLNGYPLNVMYWVRRSDDAECPYEVMDGQQRTLSLCQYVAGKFSYDFKNFFNQPEDIKKKILDYRLTVYVCEGEPSEKLEWFKTINIAGEKLTDQELRNAVYTGEWLTSAKLKFSKSNCAAYNLGNKYVNGSPIRQDYLETAISWINDGKIEEYMSVHQHDHNSNELWLYFLAVINWVESTFIKYRKEMKGINWGLLYNTYKDRQFDTSALEDKIKKLMMDDDVTNKKGIYFYVLTRNEKYLNIRAFTESQKRAVYERQNGNCPHCIAEHREKVHYELSEMEADHITPWCEGGKTEIDNCQLLCKEHNRRKSDK